MSLLRLIVSITLCLVLSLVMGHYSEPLITPFAKATKSYIENGSFGRHKEKGGDLYTSYGFHDGLVINPVHVAQKRYHEAEVYLIRTKLPKYSGYAYEPTLVVDTNGIVLLAKWFVERYKPETLNGLDVIRLSYDFDYPKYGLKAPWYSGMAQGMTIVLALAAYDITNEYRYLGFAEMLANTLRTEIQRGGTLVRFEDGQIWHEEYADLAPAKAPLVLNGNNYAIDGLFWLHKFTGKDRWKEILIESISSLNSRVNSYQSLFWSRYSLFDDYANWGYHDLHIKQLHKIDQFYADVMKLSTSELNSSWQRFERLKWLPLGFSERLFYQGNNLVLGIWVVNLAILVALLLLSPKIKRGVKVGISHFTSV